MKISIHSIMLIDDHPIIHDGLRVLLASEKNLSIAAMATSASEAMKLLDTAQPDLAIVDLSLGDSDGTYLIQTIHHKFPKVRILVYSMSEERLFGVRVASAGASGYIMKTSEPAILKEAIYAILAGDVYFSPEVKKRVLNKEIGRDKGPKTVLEDLSNREMDVFKLIGQGLDAAKIGTKLNISRNTADTHRINIKNKLGLENGKALDWMAYEIITSGGLPQKK